MKNLIILFVSAGSLFVSAMFTGIPHILQNTPEFDYQTAWGQVIEFERNGLPESALGVVNLIYSNARDENNAQQLVKSVIHILKYTEYKQEGAFVKNLNRLQEEANAATFPAKPVLHSMLAEMYWRYYQSNRYLFANRTHTTGYKNDDISTWSIEKLVDETIKQYFLSLENDRDLKSVQIDFYNEIITGGNAKGKAYRPTLYDFLAHRALNFFMDEEPSITQPANAFSLSSEASLGEAENFSKINIATKDSLSYKYYAMKIFQDLTLSHLNDVSPAALIDLDLQRLNFVFRHLTLSDKQELYLNALQKLEQKNLKYPESSLVTARIAQVWIERGNGYKANQSDKHKWDTKKAWEICQQAIDRFPDNEESALAYNLQNQIKTKDLSAEIETANLPNEPFRALVRYKNFTGLYWRAVKVTRNEVRDERKKWLRDYKSDREEKFLNYFLAKDAVKSAKVVLPDEGDYQWHSAEIPIDGLPAGDYMLIFSASPEFATSGNILSYTFTTISNLAYFHRNNDDGTTSFYVTDRRSGNPVNNAKLQAWKFVYSKKTGDYELEKNPLLYTNANGYTQIPYQVKQNNYHIGNFVVVDISYGNDFISTRPIDSDRYNIYDGSVSQFKHNPPQELLQSVLFLDRAIYRPGQVIYFKGILFSGDGKNNSLETERNCIVNFFDVNHQLVAQHQLKTNEYGSFSGTFTAPASGLTGQMYLQVNDDNYSTYYFSVEEYKRPKFEVTTDAVKGSYKLGENITVTGKATAYSGAAIDGAEVKYRVVRQARFPWWWWNRYGYTPSSPKMEITNGTTTTDAQGRFSVNFKAIPDETVDRATEPVFIFTVYADVTDVNGETQSRQATVNVGYKALELGVGIGDIDISNPDATNQKFNIKTTNLSGEFEPATVAVTIWKLQSPQKAYRERLWEKPDKFILTREEFHRLFPDDLYGDENNFYRWEKEKEMFRESFETSKVKSFGLKRISSWAPGKYMLEISSTDKFGQPVKENTYFDVVDPTAKNQAYPVNFQLIPLKTVCEPGETAKMLIAVSEETSILYELELDGKIIQTQYLKLAGEKKNIEIPITEEHRGNIAIHATFVKNSRLYTQTSIITVPYTNKQLVVQFESFRDKLQPGQQEQWRLKITGSKAEKVAAEMVVALYDASLDAFRPHSWEASFYRTNSMLLGWASTNGFEKSTFKNFERNWNQFPTRYYYAPTYDNLNWFGYHINYYHSFYFSEHEQIDEVIVTGYGTQKKAKRAEAKADESEEMMMDISDDIEVRETGSIMAIEKPGAPSENTAISKTPNISGDVQLRKNFNETAFFYPHLQTDGQGAIIVNFTIPEALTRWKMLGFAHTKDLQSALATNELKTQKELMVVPNQPRFFRENDKMYFSAKITSLTEKELSGEARLTFFDALSMKPIDSLLYNLDNQKPFSLKEKQSTNLEWHIEIPEGIQAITYRIVAKSGNFSDGEEMTLPVITNSMLVTETLPLPVRGKQTKTFRFEKLAGNTSGTLRHNQFTLEFTSNPAWYAVQALPYLMEYPYECTEQTFSRYYANAIASHISNSNTKIKAVFDTWRNIQPDALLSGLEKNQELKSALLEETPWVLQAKNESQQKRNIALLFDLNRMGNELERAMKKIMEAQGSNGGFSWFKGFPDDRYITQHIIAGMGHLDVMGIQSVRHNPRTWQMIVKALEYIDRNMQDNYEQLKAEAKKGKISLNDNHLGQLAIHYLYTRSYFNDVPIQHTHREGFDFYIGQAKKFWLQQDIYMQGMLALALHRQNDHETPARIVKSLDERALHSVEMGMSWKYNTGYFWYQAPIETQALMIEVFDEVANDQQAVEDLKVWLLKQKQTQNWKTTKATTEACYALLRRGTDLLADDAMVEIQVGNEIIAPGKLPDINTEAGTGYFKKSWQANEITPKMGNITITKPIDGVAWGAVYWQYFEQLDKITPAETPLKLYKQLFIQQNTAHGPIITPITEKTKLKPGDLIKVRIELRVDRSMEYVHLKDMRASAFEPVSALSTHKYQDGLYYYESPRDLATHFFIGWLPKGTYVFEYPLRVSQRGDFSNGITTIQCMYAPEFSSHSEGIRVKIDY
ncbi:MAG: hypothetical protein JXB34_15205 [Bacteroidales bacterium]|nr:hypothetical protein [Bacteroidales bacterium]